MVDLLFQSFRLFRPNKASTFMDYESILDQISQEVLIPKSEPEIINSFLAKTEQAAWMDASFPQEAIELGMKP